MGLWHTHRDESALLRLIDSKRVTPRLSTERKRLTSSTIDRMLVDPLSNKHLVRGGADQIVSRRHAKVAPTNQRTWRWPAPISGGQ
jgi:hypothetical protein